MKQWFTRRQRPANQHHWSPPRRFDRNLIVIGGGAAGLVSAYIGAAVKARVTLIEAHKMGGDCLNYGCVPSKALIRSARLAHQMHHAADFGLAPTSPSADFAAVMARVETTIRAIAPHDSVERYSKLGVEVLAGQARLIDPWTVEIETTEGISRLSARSIILASGASPIVPELPGLEQGDYLTSDTLWDFLAGQTQAPAKMVIVGGGPIGCELAQALGRLGSHVTLLQRDKRLLPREDAEISSLVHETLRDEGVEILTNCSPLRIEKSASQRQLFVASQQGEQGLDFDGLLFAIGRRPRLQDMGLEALGISDGSRIESDACLATAYPHIFVAGDVAGGYQFTHTAAHMAWYASVNALFGQFWRFKADYSVIPWTTFTDPEIARVGLNEQEAIARGIPVEVTRFELSELDRAIIDGATRGFVKVLTVPGKDKILGVTIVAEHAGELISEYVLAMRHGLGLNKILGTIHCYPTLAEANKYAAGEWKRAHAPQGLLKWVERYHRWRRG